MNAEIFLKKLTKNTVLRKMIFKKKFFIYKFVFYVQLVYLPVNDGSPAD